MTVDAAIGTIMLEIARYRPGEDERPTFQRYEVPTGPTGWCSTR